MTSQNSSPASFNPGITPPTSPGRIHSRSCFIFAGSAAALLLGTALSTRAETFTSTGGTQNWNVPANWLEETFPNAIGAVAIFNTPLTNQSATLAGTSPGGITVGSITFNSTGSTTMGIPPGGGGPLTFDETGAGPATVMTMGGGTGNSTISAASVLTDSVSLVANNTTTTAGVTFSGALTGPGGITKEGDGIATLSTATKAYTGATILNAGRLRISAAGTPTGTSSFTINTGGQLTLITMGSFTLGTGPLNLNGSGPTSGPSAAFPGAIRNDTNLVATISNPTVLQSDTLLHMEGAATGSLTFSNGISGPGQLALTAPNSSGNQGRLVLQAPNTFAGGTLVNGGTLVLSMAGTLGSGNVTVDNLLSPNSNAQLTISTGVLGAIADNATFTLAGGGIASLADTGFAELQDGVNESVGALVLGGISQGPGTYGSSSSGALFPNDEYFTGTGIVTVVPEPASAAVLLCGIGLIIGLRKRPRR